LVAIDSVDAGVGQIVLVIDEGNSARQVIDDPTAPVRSVIIGIVDEITVDPAAAGT
jgi:ethanolamine utilization protein EutN